jgi:anhydro-N-acetylmuramic acid kinase
MKQTIEQLCRIAGKENRLILGLMSGTSLDGLDIALCRFTGSGAGTGMQLERFETIPYTDDFRNEIRAVFARRQADLEQVCLLNAWIAKQHAQIINTCLERWGVPSSSVDLLASHGQTIYHAPLHQHGKEKFGNATLQIGDGDHLAVATGIITISDFRQKHIAAGGEGAPLAVYGDYLLFSKQGEDRIMLNMGGIANFTWLPGSLAVNEVFSTDTGPGNTLLDAYMREHFGLPYDSDSRIASKGTIHAGLLDALCDDPFFSRSFPKTTGPELFNLVYLENALQRSGTTGLGHEDIMATLTAFTARTIAAAIRTTLPANTHCTLYGSGGGIHNPLVMKHLREELPGCTILTTADLHVHPDAKEAVLFAVLANECIAGQGGFPSAVSMGKISLPQ